MTQSSKKNFKSTEIIIEKFNLILDRIINAIAKGDLTPEDFSRATTKIYELIGFTRKIVFPFLTSFSRNNKEFEEKTSLDINEIKVMLSQLLDNLEKYLRDAESHLTKDGKIDTSMLKNYLEFIGVLINNLFYIIVSTISYATGNMTEEEYNESYEEFKAKLEENKKVFKEKFE
ncbi:MAG: hypothetical protein BZ137_01145 [Methanosphaera sp. rholeuAM130]|nr:hypothetical protein [Methanosphaera sp.]RAP54639.1 MAG: hypothetical protein BZ137_01145 [Methanosphaera sp. rholeuAM130]